MPKYDFRTKLVRALLPALICGTMACGQTPAGSNNPDYQELRNPAVMVEQGHASTPPLTLIPTPRNVDTNPEHEVKPVPRHYAQAAGTPFRDPVHQSRTQILEAPALIRNFAGIGQGFVGPSGTFSVSGAPPDTNGDVGPNHYVQTVNQDLMIWDKAGNKLHGPLPVNSLFQSLGGLCAADNDGDPVVLYDQAADRWFISQFAVTNPDPNYHQCIAVSQTGDPTGAYNTYDFTYPDFNDYGKAGVWSDAYYFSYNMFTGGTTFAGGTVCAFNRSAMLAGTAATQQCFTTGTNYGGVLPADIDGAGAPAAGEPEFVIGMGTTATTLAMWKFHVDFGTPANSTFSGPINITVASYAEACSGGTCIPQGGSTQQLDSLADRMMYRLAYRSFADGHESLVVNHSVTAGTSVGLRWYEIRSPNSTPTVFQQGTFAPDSQFRWMGSAAMDGSGGIALGYSLSSSSVKPGMYVTGRNAGDAAGTMTQGETSMIVGGGSQTGGTLSRWGDYSNLTIDPIDNCTFWYTNEYIPSDGTFNWATQVASFKLSGCGGTTPANDFSIGASPTSLTLGPSSSGTSTISTAVIAGSAATVSLAVSGAPSGASASVSPTSVTAGGSSTLTVNSGSAAAGTYTITVTGTEGTTTTHSTAVTLTITAPATNDFSIAASPSSLSLVQGTGGSSTISTAVISGSAGTVSLSVSGAPSGSTASLSPTSVTAGSSSTLSINAGTAAAGTYSITVTGTEGTTSHATTVTLAVTASGGGGGIVNGGFETGSLSGWTASGASTSVTTATPHSGNYSAQLGSSVPTNGDSSIAQTFTAPSTGGTLGFYYKVVCPDTVTYDWATATLKDNTANTTATMLAKVCSNTGAYSQASATLTASHSYTLTLTSHDDNYSGDPTYTQFDDVAISAGGGGTATTLANGTFASGLTSWTVSGVICTAVTGGAQCGSSSPTNGDSSLSQTFTVGSAATTLSFGYAVSCPDTVTYDWATATLKDNATGTTTTLLAKTCSNAGTTVTNSTSVTANAGHSVTLTLTSHDDNYAADPTFTTFSNVTVN